MRSITFLAIIFDAKIMKMFGEGYIIFKPL